MQTNKTSMPAPPITLPGSPAAISGSATGTSSGSPGASSNFAAATSASFLKCSSSSGVNARITNSARRLRLRTSLSLNPNGCAENACSKPIPRLCAQSGTATMERVPKRRHACRLTRASVSVSSQLAIWAVRKQAPEKAEARSMRAPKSGRTAPAAVRKTISLLSASAIAKPSAPVIATALSATS